MLLSLRSRVHETQFPAKSPHFKESEPNIRQPNSRDCPAEEVVVGDARDQCIVADKVILGPDRDPREDKQKHTDLEAKHDVHDRQEAAH